LGVVPWARYADRLVLCVPEVASMVVDLRHPTVAIRGGENLAGEPRDTVTLTGTPVALVASAPAGESVRARLSLLWSTAVASAAHGAFRLTRT
jgi:acyl-CoA dehydrogenase